MSIFNSLGSNYSGDDVAKNLFSLPSAKAKPVLRQILGEYYGGQTSLTFKGREALELGLRRSGLPINSEVGISGFTCYVVYQAVVNAGYKPIYIDNSKRELNYGLAQLKAVHKSHPKLKAIIVQNTLGYPADMADIDKYCKQHSILVVEDLAHSTGAKYADGREAGKVGDIVMLSFSQDKPLDAVAGGALIDKQAKTFEAPPISLWQRLKLRWYPLLTSVIRLTYGLGIGRLIHFSLKKLKLLSTPMNDKIVGLHSMSSSTAKVIINNWQNRGQELAHRREIAQVYKSNLPASMLVKYKGQPSFLRFAVLSDNRQSLVQYLKKYDIYVGDTWYDTPIAPRKYLAQTDYVAGQCPNAEELAAKIVNLPTHRHVSVDAAISICERIKQWQKSPE